MSTFGSSAPLKDLQRRFGFTPEAVVAVAREVVQEHRSARATA
jgi:transketolase